VRTDREQEDLRLLRETLGKVDNWLNRSDQDRWKVNKGSPLFGDDAKTEPFHTSHAVISSISVAVDHAHALRRLTNGCETCTPTEMTFLLNSYYSLLRGGLENSARAIWLLEPASRQERVLRRLRLQTDNVGNSDTAMGLLGVPRPRPRHVREQRVREVAVQAGVNPAEASKRPNNTAVMEAAGRHIGGPGCVDQAVGLWRMCSGAAHGDVWAGLSLHDREIIEQDGGVAVAKLTAGIHVLAVVTAETFAMIDAAHDLFDLRNRPAC
jgi:hypothetical protein